MSLPGSSTKTIGDLVPEVIDALQQRTDVAGIAPRYLKRAIEEVTESNPFEELRRTGPTVSLRANTSTYSVASFLNSGEDYTSLESLFLWSDYPTNSTGFSLNYKTPKAIASMTTTGTVGIPAWWTRFGVNLILGPRPDKAYSVQAQYQVKHPFPDDASGLGGTQLMIPSSWEEIVIYSAALRIAVVKRWNDQQKILHDILYGDPEFITSEGKRGRPGIISARLFQVERDERFNSRSLGIRVPRYTSR